MFEAYLDDCYYLKQHLTQHTEEQFVNQHEGVSNLNKKV